MRMCMMELDHNWIRYISVIMTDMSPDPENTGKYIATSKNKTLSSVIYNNIVQLSDNTYADSYNYFWLTEEHPLFNASIFTITVTKYQLDSSFKISNSLDILRLVVKKSILKAESAYYI